MRIRFLAAARKEFLEAVSHYDSKEPTLGDEFADEVWDAISRIASHPSAWQQLSSSDGKVSLRGDLSRAASVDTNERKRRIIPQGSTG